MIDIQNYDDERIKLSILQECVHNCVSRIMVQGDHAYLEAELMRALYEEIIYTIEVYYWEYPFIARRLRYWIDDALRTRRNAEECSAVADAIRNSMDAHQLNSLLDRLDE